MIKIFLRLFVFLGFWQGLLVGFLVGVDRGPREGLRTGAVQGIVFGLITAALVLFVHWRRTRGYADGDVGPYQEAKLEILASSLESVLDRCAGAVEACGGKIKDENEAAGTLRARFRATLETFGVILDLKIRQVGESNFEVALSLRPRWASTILDFGHARRLIDELIFRLTHP